MTVEMPPGPPCDVCQDEPARMSIMDYNDYSQLKIGVNCAPNVLRGIADAMDGKTTAEPGTAAEPDPELSSDSAAGAPDSTSAASESDDDGQGSAADHWASTKHVVRSTHGHRRPSSAASSPREGEPE